MVEILPIQHKTTINHNQLLFILLRGARKFQHKDKNIMIKSISMNIKINRVSKHTKFNTTVYY